MENLTIAQLRQQTGLSSLGSSNPSSKLRHGLKYGVSYLGITNASQKLEKSQTKGFQTFGLYLAPAKSSGYQVCAKATIDCTALCLTESGHGRMDTKGIVKNARIKRTKLFYEDRPLFMKWLVKEIARDYKKAQAGGYNFAVRLNCTSDLSPELFKHEGEVIMDIFPDVPFYDYTKISNRQKLEQKYKNYSLTFSRSGENDDECLKWLSEGGNVAVVFEKQLPETFMGVPVINGDETDLRFLDTPGRVVGLTFKKVKNKPDPDNKFIVRI